MFLLLKIYKLLSNLKGHLTFSVCCFSWFGYPPVLTCDVAKTFSVALRVIPVRLWSPEALTRVNFHSLPSIPGQLDVNLEIDPTLKGAFKTTHSGSITPKFGEVLPPFLSENVCVKQVYFSGENGTVKHYSPAEEQAYIHSEVGCLNWAQNPAQPHL